MSEKRFEFYSDEDLIGVLDTVTGRTFNSFEIVALLNEQQSEIERLNKELIKAITKSIPPKNMKTFDKKHKPWKYVNTNCD